MTTTTSRTVEVDRPAGPVADYVLDFTTSADWDPHTVSCRRLDEGPVGVGARYENVQRLLGHETALEDRVTEYDAGRRVVLEGGSSSVHTRDEIEVRALDEGRSAVVYTVSVELLGAAQVGAPLLPTTINRIADDGERQLRERLAQRVP